MSHIEMEYMGYIKSSLLGVLMMIIFLYIIRLIVKSIPSEEEYWEKYPISDIPYKVYKFMIKYMFNAVLLIMPLFILFIWGITLLDLPLVLNKDYKMVTGEITGISNRGDVIFLSELDTEEHFRIEIERDGLTVGQVVVIEYLPYTRAGQVIKTIEE